MNQTTRQTSKTKKRKLHGWRVLLALLVLGALYVVSLLVRVARFGGQPHPAPADVIIVLGASQADGRPNPVLRARLDHGIALYRHGAAPYLLFTGGCRPGDRYTEAETGRRYAMQHGVPDDAILREDQGRTTWQSLQTCAEIMRQRGLRRAILVSDPDHGFRLTRMAQDLRMATVFSPTPDTRIRGLSVRAKFILREVGAYMVYRTVGM
jgi:uncharacterized SAM-binding protein YcdF (DUF218 family)